MPDARCTRDLVSNVHREVRPRAYRAAENIRHSLRNGFTAYSALSPENGSLASVVDGIASTNVTPAPRHQDHTTSPYAYIALVSRNISVHRDPSLVVTMANAPLSGTGWREICACSSFG